MQGAETTLFYGLWSDHNKSWRWCFSHSGVSPEVRLYVVCGGLPLMPLQIKIFHLVDWLLVRRQGRGHTHTHTHTHFAKQECKCVLFERSKRIHIYQVRHLETSCPSRFNTFSWCKYTGISFEFITTLSHKLFSLYLFKHSQFDINVTYTPIIFKQQKASVWELSAPGTDQGRFSNWKVNCERITR